MNFFLENDASRIVAKSTTSTNDPLKPFIFNPFLARQPNIRGNLTPIFARIIQKGLPYDKRDKVDKN